MVEEQQEEKSAKAKNTGNNQAVNLLEMSGGNTKKIEQNAQEAAESHLKREEHKVYGELAKVEKEAGLTTNEVNQMVEEQKEEKSAKAKNTGNNQAVNLLEMSGGNTESHLKKEEHTVYGELAKIQKEAGLTNDALNQMVDEQKEEKSAKAKSTGNNQAVNLLEISGQNSKKIEQNAKEGAENDLKAEEHKVEQALALPCALPLSN